MIKFILNDNPSSLPIPHISYVHITVNKHLTKAIWKKLFTLVHRLLVTSFKLLYHLINLIRSVLLTGHIPDGLILQAKAKCILITKAYSYKEVQWLRNSINKYKMSQYKYVMDIYIILFYIVNAHMISS